MRKFQQMVTCSFKRRRSKQRRSSPMPRRTERASVVPFWRFWRSCEARPESRNPLGICRGLTKLRQAKDKAEEELKESREVLKTEV